MASARKRRMDELKSRDLKSLTVGRNIMGEATMGRVFKKNGLIINTQKNNGPGT